MRKASNCALLKTESSKLMKGRRRTGGLFFGFFHGIYKNTVIHLMRTTNLTPSYLRAAYVEIPIQI
jgi:hypothetical protein